MMLPYKKSLRGYSPKSVRKAIEEIRMEFAEEKQRLQFEIMRLQEGINSRSRSHETKIEPPGSHSVKAADVLKIRWFGINRYKVHSYIRKLKRLQQEELFELYQMISKLTKDQQTKGDKTISTSEDVHEHTDELSNHFSELLTEPFTQQITELFSDPASVQSKEDITKDTSVRMDEDDEAISMKHPNGDFWTEIEPYTSDQADLQDSLASVAASVYLEPPPVTPVLEPAQTNDPEPVQVNTSIQTKASPVLTKEIQHLRERYLVGKIAGEDLYDSSGRLIISRNMMITSETIVLAVQAGKLADLIVSMIIPGLGED